MCGISHVNMAVFYLTKDISVTESGYLKRWPDKKENHWN